MARIFCNYTTGDDTTGDGSILNPYKTLIKGVSMISEANNSLGIIAPEPVNGTAALNLASANYAIVKEVIAVDGAGNEITTGLALTNAGACDYLFSMHAGSSPWSIRGFDISGMNEYVFQSIGFYNYSGLYKNLKISACKGVGFSANMFNSTYWEDIEISNCSGGTVLFYGTAYKMKRIKIIGCTASSTLVYGTPSIDTMIIHDCITGTAVMNIGISTNLIIDKIRFTNAANNCVFYNQLAIDNVLLRDIVSTISPTGYDSIGYLAVAVSKVYNLKSYGVTGFTNVFKNIAGSRYTYGYEVLAEDPLVAADYASDIFTLKPTYPYRRVAKKIGESNDELYSVSGIGAE